MVSATLQAVQCSFKTSIKSLPSCARLTVSAFLQVNALTSHEDKPCGSPEPKLSLPMRDPWGTEILQGGIP